MSRLESNQDNQERNGVDCLIGLIDGMMRKEKKRL
jgi:hypothetical protein